MEVLQMAAMLPLCKILMSGQEKAELAAEARLPALEEWEAAAETEVPLREVRDRPVVMGTAAVTVLLPVL